MLGQISEFLTQNPKSKARTIASRLAVDKSELNRLLHDNKDKFEQDEEFRWSIINSSCSIEFGGATWLTAEHFENAFSDNSPLDTSHTSVIFILKDGCKPMLDFIGRLLAFCNQLVSAGKKVTLDFEGPKSALSYLDRIGFFDVLNENIEVLPKRPSGNRSKAYKGNNDGVIEFRMIDPIAPDAEIPKLLQHSFVSCGGQSRSQSMFTVLAELYGNVIEHSQTTLPGFAGLQFYPKAKKIQTVISDNGLGIVGTLSQVVPQKYPHVALLMAAAEHPGVALLTEIFKVGALSQVNSDGRGLGLKLSGQIAEKFSARISIRQSNFELMVNYDRHGVNFDHHLNLPYLAGTHICFEFKLDASCDSRLN
ncbi:ATP-binding protein [Iodobacter sp. HSC-16F04]|uniref:ATP-binding protein n=1 Tax=Iodobacter violaceini TaxID=3044271 RepID=A0ABX0KRP5_9NEIS|nr:ATP-binding protein [Iodobacter violacea]NHQ87320.1 ATP-binding protein [Iodobacter violacea]